MSRFLLSGPLRNAGLDGAVRRLHAYHDAWLAHYPQGIWSEGLCVTHEMRSLTDTYLPMREIRTAFRQLYRATLRFPPLLSACPVHRSASWLNLLPLFNRYLPTTSPGALLERAAADGDLRCRMLFGMFLPSRYGCGFGRYPHQLAHIRNWLEHGRGRWANKKIRCLDAATGTGEGAYDLAHLLLDAGFQPERIRVHGSTPDPFELIAGAHGRFPHDRERELHFYQRTGALSEAGATSCMTFFQGDVRNAPGDGGTYDLVVCNGLIGGPLLHDVQDLRRALTVLIDCLAPGGLLCIADCFHDGWKRSGDGSSVREMIRRAGLDVCDLPAGLSAVRPDRSIVSDRGNGA